MRPATRSSPVREIKRETMPPVRDLRIEYGVIMTYASSSVCIWKSRRLVIKPRGCRRNLSRRKACGKVAGAVVSSTLFLRPVSRVVAPRRYSALDLRVSDRALQEQRGPRSTFHGGGLRAAQAYFAV